MTMKTDRDAHDSAIFYSIIQTALANDLKVYKYLVYLLKQMPNTDFICIQSPLRNWFPGRKNFQ